MMKLLILLLNLPLPVLGIVIAGGFFVFLTVMVLVVCIPSAGEKMICFLAQIKEVFYSKAIQTPKSPGARRSENGELGEGEDE